MTRAVYVGGFGSGRTSAEKVGHELASYFEEVDTFTFSDYATDPEKVQAATRGAELVTHSAGALVLAESQASYARLLNPPLPRTISYLLRRTFAKTVRMHTPGLGVHNRGDLRAATEYDASSLAELATHPLANFGNLRNISNFDGLRAARTATVQGTPTQVSWTDHDVYFRPNRVEQVMAYDMGLIKTTFLPGEHDEVILRPAEHLAQVFAA